MIHAGSGMGGVWISLISGLICLMFGLRFAKWALATQSGQEFNTGVQWMAGEKAGTPVAYFELMNGTAWTEAGLFIMGVALLFDAGLMLLTFRGTTPPRGLIVAAIGITGVALLINLVLAGYLLTIGVLPFISLIALLVGGLVLFDHLPMLKRR